MTANGSYTITRHDLLSFVQAAGVRYWSRGVFPGDRHVDQASVDLTVLGRKWRQVRLPAAYAHLGVDGHILVDEACIRGADTFNSCDWYLAAFSHLSVIAEWHHENAHGPIHSYAFRLSSVPAALFDYAWANRIMLLMRAMDAAMQEQAEDALFGPLPGCRFHITHDVDALDKTIPIRIKQGGFEMFNILRSLGKGAIALAIAHVKRAASVMFGSATYNHLDAIADMVAAKGVRSRFHLYAKPAKRAAGLWLMDPGYAIDDSRLRDFVVRRSVQGFTFGLHPSFADWKSAKALKTARRLFQNAFGTEPACIRQHWLRFSLRDTWRAQEEADFTLDYTLGFNDRTGFRAGTALVYRPWDFIRGQAHAIDICPTMAMDSHFYAYRSLSAADRRAAMAGLINEVRIVHGEIAVLWHPHTLAVDYGWKEGFEDLLNLIGSDA